jgi:hypothetical protein
MCKVLLSAIAPIALLTATILSGPASAADAGAVLSACDRDPKCVYSSTKDGSIVGCSQHACFVCPSDDGKRQCNQVSAAPPKRGINNGVTGTKLNSHAAVHASAPTIHKRPPSLHRKLAARH